MVVNDYLDFIHDVIVHESFGNIWLTGFIIFTVIILIVQAIVTSARGTGFEGIYIFLGILGIYIMAFSINVYYNTSCSILWSILVNPMDSKRDLLNKEGGERYYEI